MILIAKKDTDIIKKGMKFVYLRELEHFIECWSIDLELHFKFSKKVYKELF